MKNLRKNIAFSVKLSKFPNTLFVVPIQIDLVFKTIFLWHMVSGP